MPAKNAQERAAYEAARTRREQMLLRFTEEEAQCVRNAAAGSGQSIAAYVLSAVAGQPRPIVDLSEVAELSRALSVMRAAPQAVRDLEADLGRLSGRLSHLFTMDYALASEHRAEIHATLNEVRELLRTIPQTIAALQAANEEPRAEIVRVLRDINTALHA